MVTGYSKAVITTGGNVQQDMAHQEDISGGIMVPGGEIIYQVLSHKMKNDRKILTILPHKSICGNLIYDLQSPAFGPFISMIPLPSDEYQR